MKDIKHASEFLDALLESPCKGNLVGKDIENTPKLWDQVITYHKNIDYGSIMNIAAERMNS